jgi:hypothetical protein
MSETPRCDATTSGSIPNTSPPRVTDKLQGSGKRTKSRQNASEKIDVLEGHFSLEDLNHLTFQLTVTGPIFDCWNAPPADFQACVQQFADTENVNTELWPLGERVYLINHVWEECERHKCLDLFPFTVNKILTPDAESG